MINRVCAEEAFELESSICPSVHSVLLSTRPVHWGGWPVCLLPGFSHLRALAGERREEGRKESEGEMYILQVPTCKVAMGLSRSLDRWPQSL